MMLQFLWGAMTRSRILPSPLIHPIWLLLPQAIPSPSWIFHRVMYFKHYCMRTYTTYAFLLMDKSVRCVRPHAIVFEVHEDVHNVRFSPDGLFIASWSHTTEARLFSRTQGTLLAMFSKIVGLRWCETMMR